MLEIFCQAKKLEEIEKRQQELDKQLQLEQQRLEADQIFNKRDEASAKIAKVSQ